jgi:hypothetical protein
VTREDSDQSSPRTSRYRKWRAASIVVTSLESSAFFRLKSVINFFRRGHLIF